jgi:hypothetical protein
MVRADFLERVRRYSFLLTLGFSVYLGYAVYAGQITVQLGKYRGVNNSAWIGSVIGLVCSVWLSLVGFYIVKNAIQRDRETRVGQILATTPISKSFYTLGKMLSNFAVLAAMVLVLAAAALVIQLFGAEDPHIDLLALLAPVLIFGLVAVAITAALAVLFESLPVLRGGVGNIVYFFLWVFLLTLSAVAANEGGSPRDINPLTDYTGIASVMGQMQAELRQIDPNYGGGASFSLGGLHATTKTFLWTGISWTPALLLSRVALLGVAVLLALLAAVFFDRFDPARNAMGGGKKPKPLKAAAHQAQANGSTVLALAQQRTSVAQLTPLVRTGSQGGSRIRFFALVVAELRLMLRGHAWWWYTVAAGLIVACLASPLAASRPGIIVAAWIWPALIWSQMGTREARFSTGSLIFSAPRAVPRQLLAVFAAGVLVAMLTGGGLGVRLLIARDFAGLGAWAAGAIFIPALALAMGVVSGSRKPFEALYTAWWYVGPLHHIRNADFMGTSAASSTPVVFFMAAALLVVAAYLWRSVRLARA